MSCRGETNLVLRTGGFGYHISVASVHFVVVAVFVSLLALVEFASVCPVVLLSLLATDSRNCSILEAYSWLVKSFLT
jgi:hypothetical protein